MEIKGADSKGISIYPFFFFPMSLRAGIPNPDWFYSQLSFCGIFFGKSPPNTTSVYTSCAYTVYTKSHCLHLCNTFAASTFVEAQVISVTSHTKYKGSFLYCRHPPPCGICWQMLIFKRWKCLFFILKHTWESTAFFVKTKMTYRQSVVTKRPYNKYHCGAQLKLWLHISTKGNLNKKPRMQYLMACGTTIRRNLMPQER